MRHLQELPKFNHGLSYLYLEHCRIDKYGKAVAIVDPDCKTPVPCAALSLLMLGPGTSITHAAVNSLAENGCLVVWLGENGIRFYAQGMGASRDSARLLHQARLSSIPKWRLQIVMRMYRMRFGDPLPEGLSLHQIRRREGIRIREAYAKASLETGVPWSGRFYRRDNWNEADPVNRALSAGNSCLYGICHAAIVYVGYSPGLGFIHTGKQLSFVYDIADLYKAEITIPVAFQVAAKAGAGAGANVEREARQTCREIFGKTRLLERIVNDLESLFELKGLNLAENVDFDEDEALPGEIWDPEKGAIAGGVNYSEEEGASPAAVNGGDSVGSYVI